MSTNSRWLRLLALLLGFSLLAAACGDDDDEGATPTTEGGDEDGGDDGDGPAGGELVDLQNFAQGDPDHIDPGLAGVLQGAQIAQLTFDGLTEWDWTEPDQPELVGQVASEWETDDDGKTWVFTVKDDQRFANGDPVLPSSFKKAWDLAASADYASEINYHFGVIEGAEAVTAGEAEEITGVVADDEAMTLTVTLTEPNSEFPARVSHTLFSPKTDEGIEAGADYEKGVMIGNGPFTMAEPWAPGQSIILERNEEWNGGIYGEGTLAELDRIEFRISADLDSAFADFEAGNGDTGYIPAGRFAEATENYANATEPTLGVYQFYINQEGHLGGEENLKLRQAIAKAIDREAINDAVYDGTRRLPTGMTPPGVPGYEEGLCGDLCEYDAEGAQALVDEWEADGGSLDAPIVLNFNSGSGHEDVVAIVQQNLEAIGLESTLDGRDPTVYFSEMRRGDCDFCRGGWIWDWPAYGNPVVSLLHSESIDGDNLARYNNPEVDELIDQASSTVDDEERFELFRQAEAKALEEVAIVPFNWYAGQIVYTDAVENLVQTPLQFVLYEQITVSE